MKNQRLMKLEELLDYDFRLDNRDIKIEVVHKKYQFRFCYMAHAESIETKTFHTDSKNIVDELNQINWLPTNVAYNVKERKGILKDLIGIKLDLIYQNETVGKTNVGYDKEKDTYEIIIKQSNIP